MLSPLHQFTAKSRQPSVGPWWQQALWWALPGCITDPSVSPGRNPRASGSEPGASCHQRPHLCRTGTLHKEHPAGPGERNSKTKPHRGPANTNTRETGISSSSSFPPLPPQHPEPGGGSQWEHHGHLPIKPHAKAPGADFGPITPCSAKPEMLTPPPPAATSCVRHGGILSGEWCREELELKTQ